MNKCHTTNVGFRNNQAPPINQSNLNYIDGCVDTLDDRVIALDLSKAEQSDLLTALSGVTYNTTTGVFVFTWKNGTTYTVDLNVEKIPVSFSMSSAGVITMTTADGTTYTCDVSSILKLYTFVDSSTIDFTVTQNGNNFTVTADIVDGSITERKLQPNYLADITTQANAASASATTANNKALVSEGYAVGKQGEADVPSTSPYYQNNAKYNSETAEAWAVGTRNGVAIPSTDPAYHKNAKYLAEHATGGAFYIKATYNNNAWSVDKTPQEVITAYESGKALMLVADASDMYYLNGVYSLGSYHDESVASASFSLTYPLSDNTGIAGYEFYLESNTSKTAWSNIMCFGGNTPSTQVSTLPNPSSAYAGKILQYVGSDSGDLVNGYFYRCDRVTGTTQYAWTRWDTQPAGSSGGGAFIVSYTNGSMSATPSQMLAALNAGKEIVLYTTAFTNEGGHYLQLSQLYYSSGNNLARWIFDLVLVDDYTFTTTRYKVSCIEDTGDTWDVISTNSATNSAWAVTSMPSANASFAGKIVQYVGTTNTTYTKGHFYQCSTSSPYAWSHLDTVDISGKADKVGYGYGGHLAKLNALGNLVASDILESAVPKMLFIRVTNHPGQQGMEFDLDGLTPGEIHSYLAQDYCIRVYDPVNSTYLTLTYDEFDGGEYFVEFTAPHNGYMLLILHCHANVGDDTPEDWEEASWDELERQVRTYVETTDTISVLHGGTGKTTLTSGSALIGNGTSAVSLRAITNNTASSGALTGSTNLVTMNTLRYGLNRTTGVASADTNYGTVMARGIYAGTSDMTAGTTSLTNGVIYLVYE